jgi:DNA-directed RNA polymerase subunit alpha
MESILIPQKVEFTMLEQDKGQFTIEPLYPGYGITIGNMLRRVLLSSIPGAAVTTVKINGVDHEFGGMPYVKEDVVDIILNIKRIVLKIEDGVEMSKEEPLIVRIDKKGEGNLTAGDIICPSQVQVKNKDLLIATLTDQAASFEAEFTVERGLGYVPVENYKGERLSIGHMVVDAIFTPIKEAAIKVERVRVGEMTNWDKLILTIGTNGSCEPERAFDIAVDILRQQIDFLKNWKQPINEDIQTPMIEEISADGIGSQEEEKEVEISKKNNDESKKKRGRPAKNDKNEE